MANRGSEPILDMSFTGLRHALSDGEFSLSLYRNRCRVGQAGVGESQESPRSRY